MTAQVSLLLADLWPSIRVLLPRVRNFTRRLELRDLVPDGQRRILHGDLQILEGELDGVLGARAEFEPMFILTILLTFG